MEIHKRRKGVRQYNDEIILKTVTSLFLCTYLKMRYIAQNEAKIQNTNITKEIIKTLRDLTKINLKVKYQYYYYKTTK